jgi:hypothetical protein
MVARAGKQDGVASIAHLRSYFCEKIPNYRFCAMAVEVDSSREIGTGLPSIGLRGEWIEAAAEGLRSSMRVILF